MPRSNRDPKTGRFVAAPQTVEQRQHEALREMYAPARRPSLWERLQMAWEVLRG